MRPKFQKRSELKLDGRIIPHSGSYLFAFILMEVSCQKISNQALSL